VEAAKAARQATGEKPANVVALPVVVAAEALVIPKRVLYEQSKWLWGDVRAGWGWQLNFLDSFVACIAGG
jgi:hypothetical protein